VTAQSLPAVPPRSWHGQAVPGGPLSADEPDGDPVAIEVNVDAALLLKDLVGIDYPPVLVLLPNPYGPGQGRIPDSVATELTQRGILVDGEVHPAVARWLRCLDRPDVELVVRIMDTEFQAEMRGMLRMSLVRSGDDHVLAVRCDDEIVVQPVFGRPPQLDFIASALSAALGPCPALRFEPLTVSADDLAELPTDATERRRALVELGAAPLTASVLGRAFDEIERRAEIVVIQHRDGETPRPEVCATVFDTPPGRVLGVPKVALDGGNLSTFMPGDDAAVRRSIRTLIDLLPGRDWYGTSRSE
jgi:hypothetical protein